MPSHHHKYVCIFIQGKYSCHSQSWVVYDSVWPQRTSSGWYIQLFRRSMVIKTWLHPWDRDRYFGCEILPQLSPIYRDRLANTYHKSQEFYWLVVEPTPLKNMKVNWDYYSRILPIFQGWPYSRPRWLKHPQRLYSGGMRASYRMRWSTSMRYPCE